jgi:hypothetical protein
MAMNVVFVAVVSMPHQPIPCKAQPGTTTLTAVAVSLLLLLLPPFLLLLILVLSLPFCWLQLHPALAPSREVERSKLGERTQCIPALFLRRPVGA